MGGVGRGGGGVTENFPGEVKSGRRHEKSGKQLGVSNRSTRSRRKTQQSLKFTPNDDFFFFLPQLEHEIENFPAFLSLLARPYLKMPMLRSQNKETTQTINGNSLEIQTLIGFRLSP